MHMFNEVRRDVSTHQVTTYSPNILNNNSVSIHNRAGGGGGDGMMVRMSGSTSLPQYSGQQQTNNIQLSYRDRTNVGVRQLWRQCPNQQQQRPSTVQPITPSPFPTQNNLGRVNPTPPSPQPPPNTFYNTPANDPTALYNRSQPVIDSTRNWNSVIENGQFNTSSHLGNQGSFVNYPYSSNMPSVTPPQFNNYQSALMVGKFDNRTIIPPGYPTNPLSTPCCPTLSNTQQPPLVFGPPPRDKRSNLIQDGVEANRPYSENYEMEMMPNVGPISPTTSISQSIPIQSIFQSFSNQMKLSNMDNEYNQGFGQHTIKKAPATTVDRTTSGYDPEDESYPANGRSNMKLKFSKNVVNIPKKIENCETSSKDWTGNDGTVPWSILPDLEDDSCIPPQEDSAFIDMIVEGCIYGEEIATKYQNVPCFKNIKKLCEKTKNDLMTPHCTARNIHSQGIPWATKDYIFAFTRLTSAWYLLKGYLGEKSDIFEKIESLYSPNLRKSFEVWEQATSSLTLNIMKSFIALGNNGSVKWNPSAHSTPKRDLNEKKGIQILTRNYSDPGNKKSDFVYFSQVTNCFNRHTHLFKPLMNQEMDSGDEDASKKYIKPGCYPIPKYNIVENKDPKVKKLPTPVIILSHNNANTQTKEEEVSDTEYIPFKKTPQGIITSALMKRSRETTEELHNDAKVLNDEHPKNDNSDQSLPPENKTSTNGYTKSYAKKTIPFHRKSFIIATKRRTEVNDVQLTRNTVKKIHKSYSNSRLIESPKRYAYDSSKTSNYHYKCKQNSKWIGGMWYSRKREGLSRLAVQTFEDILNQLWNMPSSHYFVFEVDVRDVPDYYEVVKYPVFLTNILQKLKKYKYTNLNQVVHDFRRTFRNAQLFLEVHPDKKLQKLINNFSNAFEELLDSHFPRVDFSNITGEPNEICCASEPSSSECSPSSLTNSSSNNSYHTAGKNDSSGGSGSSTPSKSTDENTCTSSQEDR